MTTIRVILLLVLIVFGFSGCASRQFHVRGELDQQSWVIRDFNSKQSYRVIMSSGQALGYLQRLRQLGMKWPQEYESHIIEFDAYTMPPKMPWEKYESIGIAIHSDMQIERKTPQGR